MRDLNKLFREAELHPTSARIVTPTSVAYIFAGIKIEKDNETGEIIIYNTRKGGDFYKELSKVEYRMMFMVGFGVGACNIAMVNAKRSLDRVQAFIQGELTGRNNKKRYDYLKQCRVTFINNYNKFKDLKWTYLKN